MAFKMKGYSAFDKNGNGDPKEGKMGIGIVVEKNEIHNKILPQCQILGFSGVQ